MLFSQGRHSLLMKLLRQLLGFLFCFNVSLVEGILIFHQMKRISDRKLPLQIQSLEILKAASKLFVASYCRVHKSIFFQAEDGIRDWSVTGVQTCALPI